MSNKFGLFINMNYAHKSKEDCSMIWQEIMDTMLQNGFSFQKRAFSITTDNNINEMAIDIRKLLDKIQSKQLDFYSYIVDCYILNFDNCTDLTFPETSNSIDVEDISLEELEALGVGYELLLEKNQSVT